MQIQNRILIVDDDDGIRDAFQNIFTPPTSSAWRHAGQDLFAPSKASACRSDGDGYELVMVARGEAAAAMIQAGLDENRPFAMAFVDMKMPGIDGAETARRIWQVAPATKIVVMTAFSEFRTDQISRKAGRNDLFYIRKPFSAEEIRQFARSLSSQWRLERERDHLAQQLKSVNQRLARAVAERTAQLQQAFDKLQVLDQQKMTFLRYLSHEINTPLNWIGMACLIDPSQLSPDDRKWLHAVEKGFNRLGDLVQAVLGYFSLAAGDLELKTETLNLRAELRQVVERYQDALSSGHITLRMPALPERAVVADRTYFRELLATVVDNAIRYSAPGDAITITGSRRDEPFSLAIQDQGKGIEARNLENIFKPFVLPDFDRHENGCGLNLPRAGLIAAAHGWRIWAESQGAGQGARIVIAEKEGGG